MRVVSLVLGLVMLTAGPVLAAGRPSLHGTEVFQVGQHRAPDFTLRDVNGGRLHFASLRGHVVALTFLDSQCRQQCPLVGRELATAQRHLGGGHSPLVIVVVSVAPRHDTPRSVHRFMRDMRMTGRWYWLTGTQEQLNRVWVEWGIEVVSTVTHTSAVYLVDRHGWVRVADGDLIIPSQLVESVRALLN
ncbi:MAG TPA: SCO family protein [Chloroflexota bacterium]|nr:SCO family protein [Chloroflexota bacterium]